MKLGKEGGGVPIKQGCAVRGGAEILSGLGPLALRWGFEGRVDPS